MLVRRASFVVLAALVGLLPSACRRPTRQVSAEPPSAPVEVKPPPPPTAQEEELMADFAREGAQALSSLGAESDVAHGATWRCCIAPTRNRAHWKKP